MKTGIFVLFFILSLFARAVFASELIVTVKGEGAWAKESRKDGNKLIYVDEKTGTERVLPLKDVDTIIPRLDKSKSYSDEQIAAVLEKIEEVKKKYLKLVKKLNVIATEWKATLKTDPLFERKIQLEVSRFKRYRQTPDSYNQVVMNLQMLKFKDPLGSYSKQIDDAIKEIKDEYLGVDFQEFLANAKAEKIDFKAFLELKKSYDIIMERGSEEDKKTAKEGLDSARGKVFALIMPYPRKLFAQSPSLANYLRGKTALLMLLDISETIADRTKVNTELAALSDIAKKRLTAVDFSFSDFPLIKSDKECLEATKDFSSISTTKYVEAQEEWAYIVPLKAPVYTGENGILDMPFTVVFKKTPILPMEYSVMLAGARYRRLSKHYIPVSLKINQGHAAVPFKVDLSKVAKDMVGIPEYDGGKNLYLYLAARDKPKENETVDDESWKLITLGCCIPMPKPGEEQASGK